MNRTTAFACGPAWQFSLLALSLGFWPVAGFGLSPAHECAYCHDVHSAAGVTILAEPEVEVLCLTCHIAGALDAAPDADVHTNRDVSDYADFRATCLDCHNPHDNVENWIGAHVHDGDTTIWGINIKLVGSAGSDGFAVIQSTEWDATMEEYVDDIRYVVFEQVGSNTDDPTLQIHSFSDEDMDGLTAPDGSAKDGPCEVCHNQTKYHCNGDDSNIGACGIDHNTGRVCTQCHHHDANFLPQSGGTQPGGH